MENGKRPLRPRTLGKDLMVPDSLTPGGRLAVRLLPRRYATEHPEYGKDKYWQGEDMVGHIAKITILIFSAAPSGCQAVFAFENASNSCSYAADALRAESMNPRPGGKQGVLQEGIIHGEGLP